MTSNHLRPDSVDLEKKREVWERTVRALSLASALLLTFGSGLPAWAASGDPSSLTEPGGELASSSTSSSSPIDRAELHALRAELVRAELVLKVLRDDVSAPSVTYLDRLSQVLARVSEPPVAAEIRALMGGLRQAWSALAQADPLVVLAAHPTRPQLREPAVLDRALRDQPELVSLAFEALDAAERAMGRRAGLSVALEPFVDPELSEETVHVYLVFVTHLSVDATSEIVDAFEEQWFLDNCHRADGRLSSSIDYA
jgi:hypothetical protein